jgi:hypothetical protein
VVQGIDVVDRTSLLDAALAADDAEICVVPAARDGSKRPGLDTWKQFQRERPSREQVQRWFADDQAQGLGYLCGQVSGGLEMLEFEERAIVAGLYTEFYRLAKAAGLGELVDLIRYGYEEETPSGGVHWLWRCDEVSGNLKLARRPGPGEHDVEVLIETRGEGGFAIAAPSGGTVHPNGGSWELAAGGVDSITTITADERAELLRIARSLDRIPPRDPPRAPSSMPNGDRPGDQFNASTTWPDLLEPYGWVRVYDHGQETAWRRPGKDRGISATTNHTGTDHLKVFSSSTVFDTESTYDRFGAYALLEHGGDLGAAARALHRETAPPTADIDTMTVDEPPADHEPPDNDPAQPPSSLPVFPVRQTLATPPPEPEPLAAGLANRGEKIVCGAGRAWNKSLLVAQLTYRLAGGDGLFLRDFLIKRPCRSLLCQGEVTRYQSWVRWRKLTDGGDAPDGVDEMFARWKIRTIRKRRRDPIEDCYEEWPEAVLDPRLEATIAERGYDLLVLDPWASYFSGAENSNDETEAALDKLSELSARYSLAVWINHHFSQRGMTDKIDPEDAWRGASRLADWADTRITLVPHYTPKQAQNLGHDRLEARRYLDVRFLTRGAPIDDFSLHRRDDLWLERWEDPHADADADDHVEALIDPVAEAVDARPATILNKQDVFDQLKAAKVKFNANNLAPAILLAAERGLIKAEKSGNTWRIRAIKKTP